MPDELTKALLLEEVADERAIAEALFTSVTGGVPLVQALVDSRAVPAEILNRYLARTASPFLRQVVPVVDIVDALPPGLCARLLAVPVRRDAITGTVDVVVPDAGDEHVAREIAFHLQAPVRLVRAPLSAIDEALRKLRHRSMPESRPPPASRPPARVAPPPDDERMYDSRPRAPAHAAPVRQATLPPPDPMLGVPKPPALMLDGFAAEAALRPSRVPIVAHVVPPPSSAAPPALVRKGRDTPTWGTPVHSATADPQKASEAPVSGLGSEIPIPLTRRTYTTDRGGTQRPPPLRDPTEAGLGEGIPVDPAHLRNIVEVRGADGVPESRPNSPPGPTTTTITDIDALKPEPQYPGYAPIHSFIPGPPPVPAGGRFAAFSPQLPFADVGGILSALRGAGSRDEVLELVLTGARMVALRVALFVVKRGGYLGWACTPEFGDRSSLQTVLLPLDAQSMFDEAVREGLYLGPIRHDSLHMPLLGVMRSASRDVAVVPIRVSGRAAVLVVADDLGDTMLATRRLEELARAAGDAFSRIVRLRR